jgi:NAD+ kinase
MLMAIYSRSAKPEDEDYLRGLLECLGRNKVDIVLYGEGPSAYPDWPVLRDCQFYQSHAELLKYGPDGFVCLGGDGTLLQALTLVRDSGIPVLGINTGRLGFLASIDYGEIDRAVQAFVQGHYTLDHRTLLQIDSAPKLFDECPWAINDATILKRDSSSMITIDTFLNGDFLNTYWADGLIISTPTGSTGYSLSCGGPIVFPHSGNFILTPVAPHNLGVRPVVIPDEAVLSFEVRGRGEQFLLTLDSRHEVIRQQHEVAVRKAPFQLVLVHLNDYSFLSTLRRKLAWGRDFRN